MLPSTQENMELALVKAAILFGPGEIRITVYFG